MAYKKWTASDKMQKPDPKYDNELANKFVNCLMCDGKKSVAQRIFYDALELIAAREKERPPIDVFVEAVNNVKPTLEVRSKRVGGTNYQVPMSVRPKRQTSLAIRWILQASRGKKGKPLHERLAEELLLASRREGTAMTTRENVHRMAEANKAFAHFAW